MKHDIEKTSAVRTRGEERVVSVTSLAKWTKLTDLGGDCRSGYKDVAILIQRVQKRDRRNCRCSNWGDYPTNRHAFVAYGSPRGVRLLGVGDKAGLARENVAEDEHVAAIKLPFEGCGRDLAEAIGIYHIHAELLEQYRGRRTGAMKKDKAVKVA